MRTARFFIPLECFAFAAQAFSIPAGPLHKQITHVLRMKVGDVLSLLPGDGREFSATITAVTRSAVMGTLGEVHTPPLPLRNVTLCAAITKRDTFSLTLQKCTELGVSAIIPMHTDRTIKRTAETTQRWYDIVRESSEQCGRGTLPLLHAPCSFNQALEDTRACARILFHESGEGTTFPPLQKNMPLALFIGPEGGFTPDEVARAVNHRTHVVRMGDFVLRAETAAIVACAKVLLG